MNHSKIFLFFASFVFSSIFFLFFASNVEALAEVVINEFSPASSPEWVELYNPTGNEVSLDGFVIYFHSTTDTTQKRVFCSNYKIAPQGFLLIETTRYLADTGDTIILKQYDDIVDTVSYGAGQAIPTLTPNQSAKRNPDGSPNWEVSNEPSKNGEVLSFSCPTPTPSPTPSPTPTPTQSSEKPKATLKINSARDQNDSVITGATKIYIDGNYTGNYASTVHTYTFCDDCKCGSNKVSCGFGSHTIKVEKTGYKSWTKTIDISAGNSYEETPILTISTPTPSPTPKPSATPKTSPTPSLEAENTIQASESALTLNSSSEPRVLGLESAKREEDKEASSSDSYFNLAAVFFIIAGLSFLLAASYAYFKSKKKKEEKQNENKDSEDQEDF